MRGRSIGMGTLPTGALGASRPGEGCLLTCLRHGDLAHKYFSANPAWRRGSSDRSSARRPCPQVLQRHPGVAKGGFWPVFGTVTLPTGTSGASSRGEGGFWPVFGTATLPTSALGASPRGETVISPTSLRLVTFTEQAHHAYRPLRGRLPCAVKPIGLHRANDYAYTYLEGHQPT